MAIKQTGRRTYKSMQGKPIDMDLLRKRNELTPAVGNARVNARGDELGRAVRLLKNVKKFLQIITEIILKKFHTNKKMFNNQQ